MQGVDLNYFGFGANIIQRRSVSAPPASPAALFSGGQQGRVLDPSDLSTMFQDPYGEVPAVVDQRVGLRLDKRLWQEQSFDDVMAAAAELKANFFIDKMGTATTATYDTSTGAGTAHRTDNNNQSYVQIIGLGYNNARIDVTCVSGTVAIRQGTAVGTIIKTLTEGQSASLIIEGTTLSVTRGATAGSAEFVINSCKIVPGNHTRQIFENSRAYLRSSAGLYWLESDGVDDFYVSLPLDFTNTDELTVMTAIRKSLDGSVRCIVEFGTDFTDYGGWYLFQMPSNIYSYSGRGNRSGLANDTADYAVNAPDTSVLTIQHKLNGGNPATLRRNKVLVDSSVSTTFGGGNFGFYAIYDYRRTGTQYPAPLRDYGQIILGALASPEAIAVAEDWLMAKAGL